MEYDETISPIDYNDIFRGNKLGYAPHRFSYPFIRTVKLLLRNKKVSFVYRTKETFLRDAFLAERDAHCVRDADFVCDARLRRVCGTHRITYHSVAASLLTKLFDVANSFKISA